MFQKVAKRSELTPGKGCLVQLQGQPVALFHLGHDTYHAIHNTCVHVGGPLIEGDLDLETRAISCPWHGWTFDLATGACTRFPDAAVPTYEVQLQGDDILLRPEADA